MFSRKLHVFAATSFMKLQRENYHNCPTKVIKNLTNIFLQGLLRLQNLFMLVLVTIYRGLSQHIWCLIWFFKTSSKSLKDYLWLIAALFLVIKMSQYSISRICWLLTQKKLKMLEIGVFIALQNRFLKVLVEETLKLNSKSLGLLLN